jgi:hypothetical protein
VADNPNRGGRTIAWLGMAAVLALMFVFFAE